ncbi:MAG: IscS subfamily cysteine desulfurase [Actinobacteria bacterium]|nr:IscS subfamily cysteine desulfurase [Actinomycetota bacterium]
MKLIYLDHAATTPPLPEVRSAMDPFLGERFGNPSALYGKGREARAAIEESRGKVASLISALPGELFFTSGGSESDNFALWGTLIANSEKGNHIVTTAIEHHAVLETAEFLEKQGYDATVVGVDEHGMVDPGEVRKALRPDTVVVSVMHANNEMGTIQPIHEIASVCGESGVYLHTDAVQTVGNIPVNVEQLGIDLLSLSGHKLYGPKGVGAVFIRKGTNISSLAHGGAQERRMRAGTENVPGIVGLGVAAEYAGREMAEKNERISGLRDYLIDGVLCSVNNSALNGHRTQRLPNNASFTFAGVEGEAVCLHLDALGICASTGSACDTESLMPSHVLLAMGVDPRIAQSSVRFTLGRGTTRDDVNYVIEKLPPIIERLRSISQV